MVLCAPIISIVFWKEDALLLAMFNPLYNSMNQQLFKKNFYNQSSHYENYRWFPLWMEAIMCLKHFVVSKDKWDTKEGTGKSMKNALYAQWYGKWHLLGLSNIKQRKIKPIALAVFKLHKSEGISQAVIVRQSVENSKIS